LDIAVAMGLIISKFVKGPFKHNVITFNTNPEFVKINDGTLYERFTQIRNILKKIYQKTNNKYILNLMYEVGIDL
jgi:hypothetical protein